MAVAARQLDELSRLAAPVSLAGEQRLPVLPALEPLLPGGLRRGWVVAVEGSSSLALALVAAASAEGSWCAAVGRPALGPVAAAELGIALDRFPMVPDPGPGGGGAARRGGWAWVVAALVDAFDLVVAWLPPPGAGRASPPGPRPPDARRLVARARERGSVLVVAGAGEEADARGAHRGWPEPPDVRLSVARSRWVGIGDGHGRLVARWAEVVAGGRGAASRPRRAGLWLPAAGGGVAAADPEGDDLDLREVG